MKFYDFEQAPNPRRARIAMAEKGVTAEIVPIDLGAKEQFSDAFKQVNPRCTVPVLELDDGTRFSENAAIVRYLEETYPEPPLLGCDPVEKAMVAEWTARCEWEGLMGVAEALRNTSEFFKDSAITGPQAYKQIPELAERGLHRAEAFFTTLDNRFGQSPYLAGEAFSYADIVAYVFVGFARWVRLKPSEELQHLANWFDAVSQRPSASA